MMGSGTTLVETMLSGRRAIGVDIDPLAVRLARVKTTRLASAHVAQIGQSIETQASNLLTDRTNLRKEIERRYDSASRAFLDYWFAPKSQDELVALVMTIDRERDPHVHEFLQVVLSSIIITKRGGVSLATD